MDLHELCLAFLNHPIPQALACGKALKHSSSRDLILTFGSLHFFVVSGAHLNFVQHYLSKTRIPKSAEVITLGLFVMTCNFSAPITRSFLQYSLCLKRNHSLPKELLPLFSYFICAPVFIFSNHFTSLGLSFLFTSIISINIKSKYSNLLIYILALPVFLNVLGLPHYSSVHLLPFVTVLIALLLPLSFLSLFSNFIEAFVVKTWWFFEDSLKYLHTFYNHPVKPKADFHSFTNLNLFFYGAIISLTSYLLGVLWRRSSYSF